MTGLDNFVLIFRLLLAAVLGGLVGFEREWNNRPAGLRTHILVCVGAVLATIVSVYGFNTAEIKGDQARIAAQVVSGIGFLGAGTIMRQGSMVRGLTTAASLWAVAGIGLAVGIGLYVPAVAATVLVLVSLFVLSGVDTMLLKKNCSRSLWVKAVDQPGLLGHIGTVLGEHGVSITNVVLSETEYMESYKADTISIDLQVIVPAALNVHDLVEQLLKIPGMLEVSWEGGDTSCEWQNAKKY